MTINERYPKIYNTLKLSGFSPVKAVEILLDAKRRDSYALTWIWTSFRLRMR